MNLPAAPPTTLWQDLAELQRFAEDVQARMSDPAQKRMLGDMLKQFSAARAEAQEVVPGILVKIKQEAETAQAELPKLKAELERLEAELEAKFAEAKKQAEQAAAPATTVEPPVDLKKGQQLADELRQRFAPPKTAAETPFEDAGSVAREWVETEGDSAAHPGPHRPPTMSPTPPSSRKPEPEKEPKKGDDIWEGLSRMEGD
jgi:hypothetical protein